MLHRKAELAELWVDPPPGADWSHAARFIRSFPPQVSILSSFESRLMALENSIIPVHKQTENLQRLQENVDKTLFCLDHVISYYHVAKDTDKIIKEGCVYRLQDLPI